MKVRHINCQDTKCPVCLNDAVKLEKLLQEKTGTGNKYDLLGKYHKWLADNGIPNETEWGWPSVETYDDDNIERFCEGFKKEVS